jgi:hypothetical protein
LIDNIKVKMINLNRIGFLALMMAGLLHCSTINEIDLGKLLSLFDKTLLSSSSLSSLNEKNETTTRKENDEIKRTLQCFFEAQCALECVKYIECVRYAFEAERNLCSLFIVKDGGNKRHKNANADDAQVLDKMIGCELKACSVAGRYCSATSGCLCETAGECSKSSPPKYELSQWVSD